jgi:hypothetical protein
MAFPTINFASLGYELENLYSNESNVNSIRITGDFVSGTNTITNCAITLGPLALSDLLPGMIISSTGEIDGETTIVSIVGSTITMADNAVGSGTTQTARIKNPKGQYLFVSASFSKVGSGYPTDLRSVTGSEDTEYDPNIPAWGIASPLAYTGSVTSTIAGLYGQYTITKIQSRISNTIFNFFATGSDTLPSFIEASGSQISAGGGNLLLSEIENNLLTVAGANDLSGGGQGLGLAAYQTAVGSVFSTLTSGSGGDLFPYTGSAQITGSLSVTGSSTISLTTNEKFLINNATAVTQSLFQINNEGVAIFRAREGVDGVPTPVVGGMYFTTSSAYIGLN